MNQAFSGWGVVSQKLIEIASANNEWLNDGQRASLRVIAARISKNGLVLADEVGMGKTRIAVAVARAVLDAGGRVAIVVPPGLGYQWSDELRHGGVPNVPPILRTLRTYLGAWDSAQEPIRAPWFDQPLVLISHAFSNWRFGASNEPWRSWRWALLPAIYAEWRKRKRGRYPRGFYAEEHLEDARVCNAAKSICNGIPEDSRHVAHQRVRDLAKFTPWPDAINANEYRRDSRLRPWLERAIGLGLGEFDLVVIDEAHKGRGAESRLSSLLNSVLMHSGNARRLGMTATPVELDVSQWQQTLGRIGVTDDALSTIKVHIEEYARAIKRVRLSWRSNADARKEYRNAAQAFEHSLSPYLLRRDKREDDAVKAFSLYTGQGVDKYRGEKEVLVEPQKLLPAWRQAICAAESLSLVTRYADDPVAKRLRLTMGSGHAVASLIDQIQRDEADQGQEQYEEKFGNPSPAAAIRELGTANDGKRQLRGQWWRELMENAFKHGTDALFEHPAILAAVECIEAYAKLQQKVLVFGRFTRPLRALTQLLNARELLRSLEENRSWPQSRVHRSREENEWPAVKAAYRQLNCTFEYINIDRMLSSQYAKLEQRRERLRDHLFEWISEGLGTDRQDARTLLEVAKVSARANAKALLARAIDELLEQPVEPTAQQIAQAFVELTSALRDRDEFDRENDQDIDGEEANTIWSEIEDRLREDYGPQRGTFARFMYGDTLPATRRTLQLAFNRTNSFPRVLVAQSMVGREGLNLHQACRVVVLLHPEWNPAVVEQQIGRVDRVGSHWSKEVLQGIETDIAPTLLPRIEICPVIFRGSYDEHHWKVLNERWDDLRAQLHGIVVPQRLQMDITASERQLIAEMDRAAPNFSPLRQTGI